MKKKSGISLSTFPPIEQLNSTIQTLETVRDWCMRMDQSYDTAELRELGMLGTVSVGLLIAWDQSISMLKTFSILLKSLPDNSENKTPT